MDRINLGVDMKHCSMTEEQKRRTAIHEGGHVLMSLVTEGADKLHKATILPRGKSLGVTHFFPREDENSITRKNILAKIDVALGGRAAEELMIGEDHVTTGCNSDL